MKKLVLLAVSSLLCSAVAAETYGVIDLSRTRINRGGADTFSGWSLHAGYRFGNNLAVEAGYRSLGNESAGSHVKANTLQMSGLGYLPLSTDFQLFARLGVNQVERTEWSGNTLRNADAFFGFGADYRLSPTLSLRTEFQKPNSDTRVLSLGLKLSF